MTCFWRGVKPVLSYRKPHIVSSFIGDEKEIKMHLLSLPREHVTSSIIMFRC